MLGIVFVTPVEHDITPILLAGLQIKITKLGHYFAHIPDNFIKINNCFVG